MAKKHVYFFGGGKADGNRKMRDLLGGKGAGLAEMTNAGLPVPPGFTISTEVCNIYYKQKGKLPGAVDREIAANLRRLEKDAGAKLGSVDTPLLVSVRSGAKFSMPGMMDTILNLGLNDRTVEGLFTTGILEPAHRDKIVATDLTRSPTRTPSPHSRGTEPSRRCSLP